MVYLAFLYLHDSAGLSGGQENTVEGISVPSQLQNVSGSILWVVYGIASSTHLVVLANVMTICGFGTVVAMQVRLKAVPLARALTVEIRAARTRHLVGVSVVTFIMVVVMSASWGIYGVMIKDLYVALPNVVIVPSALFISVRAIQSHRRYGSSTTAKVNSLSN